MLATHRLQIRENEEVETEPEIAIEPGIGTGVEDATANATTTAI